MNNDSLNATTMTSYVVDSDVTAETVVKATVLVVIIASAIVGNAMVIVSVLRFDKLRIMANTFIVSLASADLLVALLVMPFSASQEIAGRWLFTEVVCDIFNANDVLFSTASLLHLCCISMDRYIAITDPFGYDRRMTRPRVALTLAGVWSASALLSHVPVHLKWYVQKNQPNSLHENECTFSVNLWYGIVSSSVSFWTPALVMVFTYITIYREARRQEKLIAAMTHVRPSMLPGDRQSLAVSRTYSSDEDGYGSVRGVTVGQAVANGGMGKRMLDEKTGRKMKREHKAAKTLGIIMGAFLLCWLPFFTWYLTDALCQGQAWCVAPRVCVSALFWIGYTNSALNPVIYACFNRDFRFAFKRILGSFGRWRAPSYIASSERISLKMNPISRSSIAKV